MRATSSCSRQGFTLVELSIALVILALLIGGVMGGKSLIRSSELKAVQVELQQWRTAVNGFYEKYDQYPGDFDEATDYWSGTSNGDGDGIIGEVHPERFLFWQHLSLAKLIPGDYTGVAGIGGSNHHVLGENAPASDLKGAGWSMETIYGGSPSWRFEYDYVNALFFGGPNTCCTTSEAVLTPQETWNIDRKIDDGLPGKGRVIAYRMHSCTNTTDELNYEALYDLDDSEEGCSIYFKGVIE